MRQTDSSIKGSNRWVVVHKDGWVHYLGSNYLNKQDVIEWLYDSKKQPSNVIAIRKMPKREYHIHADAAFTEQLLAQAETTLEANSND